MEELTGLVYSGSHLMGQVNQVGHLSKTHLNLLEMFEIIFVGVVMPILVAL